MEYRPVVYYAKNGVDAPNDDQIDDNDNDDDEEDDERTRLLADRARPTSYLGRMRRRHDPTTVRRRLLNDRRDDDADNASAKPPTVPPFSPDIAPPRTNCLTHRTTASSWTIYPWTCSSEYLPPYNASAKSSSTEVADTDAVQARVMSTPSLHICPLQTFAPGQSPAPDICLSRTVDPRIFAAPEHPPPNICRHTMPLPSLRRRRFQMAMRYRSG